MRLLRPSLVKISSTSTQTTNVADGIEMACQSLDDVAGLRRANEGCVLFECQNIFVPLRDRMIFSAIALLLRWTSGFQPRNVGTHRARAGKFELDIDWYSVLTISTIRWHSPTISGVLPSSATMTVPRPSLAIRACKTHLYSSLTSFRTQITISQSILSAPFFL